MFQNRVVNYAIPSEFRSEGVVCSEIIPPLRGFASLTNFNIYYIRDYFPLCIFEGLS